MSSDVAGSGLGVKRIEPAYRQVADQLRDQILSGALQPGDRLPVEAELSAAFGVSRSTAREALRLLGSQDLIHTVRGVSGGTFVSQTDHAAISEYLETRLALLRGRSAITSSELLEARRLLEVPATRLAATRRTDAQLAQLRQAIDREREVTDGGRRFATHQHFHALVLEAAGNRLIGLVTTPISAVIRGRFRHDEVEAARWREVDDDHVAILGRIEAGDAGGAAGAMDEHLDRLHAIYRLADPD
jgi:DNA-binding FadR family transcriptional regulator